MPKSKGKPSKDMWGNVINGYCIMEVGGYNYEFQD